MRQRTQSRELALQTLYQLNFHPDVTSTQSSNVTDLFPERRSGAKIIEYAKELVDGYFKHRHQIDDIIRKCATNWKFERIALVDRAILQLAAYELLFCDDIPRAVAINEAVELAKKYGSAGSPSFVNGVLDKIASENKKKLFVS